MGYASPGQEALPPTCTLATGAGADTVGGVQLNSYKVEVKTSDMRGAGTDANVTIQVGCVQAGRRMRIAQPWHVASCHLHIQQQPLQV